MWFNEICQNENDAADLLANMWEKIYLEDANIENTDTGKDYVKSTSFE
jgi:hypothetical protein